MSDHAVKPRLLVVGDAVATTGFSRVTHSVLTHLADRYEVHHLGVNYRGDPHGAGWKIYPAGLHGDLLGVNRIEEMIAKVSPDLIFLVNDVWVLADYVDRIAASKTGAKVAVYCPVDSGPLDGRALARLARVDRFVVYTRFAAKEARAAVARLARKDEALRFPTIDVIPHGVDTRVFRPLSPHGPLSDRRAAIQALFGGDPDFDDAFIVLNANRNQPRKRVDVTMKGFALFAANKPGRVKLHLHMGVEDAGWNVIELSERLDIADRLVLTSRSSSLPSVPDAQLAAIYNAAAVGLNTSTGEGWGLPAFEHAATGGAQVVPRHSACAELWEGHAMLLDPTMTLVTEKILTEEHLIRPEAVAEALEALYEDPRRLEDLARAAYENATRPEYAWPAVAVRWDDLFRAMLGRSPEGV